MSRANKAALAKGAEAICKAESEAATANAAKLNGTLTGITKELARLHRENLQAACATVTRGIRCGEILYSAKDQVEHGAWLPWLREHAPFSVRTAQNYMRCYEQRDELKTQRISHLNRAYSFLRRLADNEQIEPEKPKSECRMSPAEEQLVSKGIARDASDARRLLKEHADKETSEREQRPELAPNCDKNQPEPKATSKEPKGWTPPSLEKSDLTDKEREVIDALAGLEPLRRKAIVRSICDGGLLEGGA